MVQLDDDERRALRLRAREATLAALRAFDGEAQRDEIHRRALADGGFTEREHAAPAPEAAGERYASAVEHALAWALTNLRRDGLVERPRRGVWRLAGAAREPAVPLVDEPAPPDRLAQLRTMPYAKYLRTSEWRKVRAAALLRAGNACALDMTHTEHLEVHHRTYERRGAELPTDIIVLCRECHRRHHDGRPEPDRPDSLLGRLLRRRAA
jgi:restriction endonuclease Mrr